MNQERIGKFISLLRKENKMTQQELAEKLNISDKAVSKWERGICCPDISLLIPISEMFGITVNELLLGEKVSGIVEREKLDSTSKDFIKYSCKEIKTRKKRNYHLLMILFITIVVVILTTCGIIYKRNNDKVLANKYVDEIEYVLKQLKFKKDNPLISPNYIKEIDGMTYMIPNIDYTYNKIDDIYKEIVVYTDYETLNGLTYDYLDDQVTIYDNVNNEINTITCDKYGKLLNKKSASSEELEFYNKNKKTIKKQLEKLNMLWYTVYEDTL